MSFSFIQNLRTSCSKILRRISHKEIGLVLAAVGLVKSFLRRWRLAVDQAEGTREVEAKSWKRAERERIKGFDLTSVFQTSVWILSGPIDLVLE